ncbi:hypothetical protein Bbelb_367110 [Branchiostoma belcheri]|nr:hypothetical protein Bbelb_367110 [Branchiostoma belcheri]
MEIKPAPKPGQPAYDTSALMTTPKGPNHWNLEWIAVSSALSLRRRERFEAANQASITALRELTAGRRQKKTKTRKSNTGSQQIHGNQLEIGPWYNSPVLGKGRGRKITAKPTKVWYPG